MVFVFGFSVTDTSDKLSKIIDYGSGSTVESTPGFGPGVPDLIPCRNTLVSFRSQR